jgi:hypothetical protein
VLVAVALAGCGALATAGAADTPPGGSARSAGSADFAAGVAQSDPLPFDKPLAADFDGDGVKETARAHETACFTNDGPAEPPCEHGGLRSFYVEVQDACATGALALTLSREMDFASLAEVIDADGDGNARELAFELRAGATARGVQAKIVRFRAGADGCVAVQKTLFSYPRLATIGKRPKGTAFATGYLSIHDYDKGIRGLELRTIETYSRPTDPGCCPSFRRVTFWRYVASRSGYQSYRTKLAKLPRPR